MNKKLKTSAEGRRCQFSNCHRLLSIYNHESYCRVHLQEIQKRAMPKPYRHGGK